MKNVTCVLHHHIGPESTFELGLNVASTVAAFTAHIDWIVKHHNVISLEQLLSGDIPPRAALLTFDDGYRSVLEVMRSVLAPKGLPSVVFLNPGVLKIGGISLDNTLAWATNVAGLAEVCTLLDLPQRDSVGTIVGQDMARLSANERAAIRDRLLAEFGPPDTCARAPLIARSDIKELIAHGVEIGNHTMSHVHCRSLKPQEFEEEIATSKAVLEDMSGQRVRSFAVPYGHEDDLTPAVLDYLRATGHEAIFLVHELANFRRPAPDIWYRTSLHNESRGELNAKVRVRPFVRTLRRLITKP